MSHRYFFALWPDAATRDRLAAIGAQLSPGTGKPVNRDNLHITLSFLGPRDAAVVEKLRKGAAEIQGRAFKLQLDQSGWWRKPQVAWLGTAQPPPALLELAAALNRLLTVHGIRPDDRPFAAHLTIARKVTKQPRGFAFDYVIWPISSFCLVQSRTLPAGAEYEVIATWPLSSD